MDGLWLYIGLCVSIVVLEVVASVLVHLRDGGRVKKAITIEVAKNSLTTSKSPATSTIQRQPLRSHRCLHKGDVGAGHGSVQKSVTAYNGNFVADLPLTNSRWLLNLA